MGKNTEGMEKDALIKIRATIRVKPSKYDKVVISDI
jgi:hypothetical protein